MVFSEFELKRYEKALKAYIEKNRPPPHIRNELDLSYRQKGQSVEMFEIRPRRDNPQEKMENPVAKATYVIKQGVWKIYWQRTDLKWHAYEPHPKAPIPEKIYNCHCSQCRKSHGAAFATQAFAKGSTLKFLKGEEFLKEYRGYGGVRAFCSNCGSRLMNYAPDKSLYLSIALSGVDSDYDGKPITYANVDSKASWHSPSEDIPSYPGMPDGALD